MTYNVKRVITHIFIQQMFYFTAGYMHSCAESKSALGVCTIHMRNNGRQLFMGLSLKRPYYKQWFPPHLMIILWTMIEAEKRVLKSVVRESVYLYNKAEPCWTVRVSPNCKCTRHFIHRKQLVVKTHAGHDSVLKK